jgi:hypothetical protein
VPFAPGTFSFFTFSFPAQARDAGEIGDEQSKPVAPTQHTNSADTGIFSAVKSAGLFLPGHAKKIL